MSVAERPAHKDLDIVDLAAGYERFLERNNHPKDLRLILRCLAITPACSVLSGFSLQIVFRGHPAVGSGAGGDRRAKRTLAPACFQPRCFGSPLRLVWRECLELESQRLTPSKGAVWPQKATSIRNPVAAKATIPPPASI